tara:strand:- start:1364 stop:1720 length:357 start_codon:yes stop_codon:yes gene_type:complete
MALKLTLPHSIQNTSLQVGDVAYSCNVNAIQNIDTNFVFNTGINPQLIGTIDAIGQDYVVILEQESVPDTADFLMFSKDKAVNNTSLIGYYAQLQFKNNSDNHAELFSVSAEVAPSSK